MSSRTHRCHQGRISLTTPQCLMDLSTTIPSWISTGATTPSTNPSWFSLERSSSVLFLVSLIISVEPIPVAMKRAKISRLKADNRQYRCHGKGGGMNTYICFTNAFLPGAPPISLNLWKPTCATIAPSLPLAAEIP